MIAPARTAPAPAAKAGIGLRAPHYVEVVETRPAVGWFEIHAENFMGGGPPLHYLETVRRDWPISVHGVGLSLGSVDGLDPTHLDRLAQLVARIEPALVSEHLAWSVFSGTYLNDLLPLPYTPATLDRVVAHVDQVQTALRRPILLENPATYVVFAESEIPETEFLAAIAARTGCGLLLDVNNVLVSCTNHRSDPGAWLAAFPLHRVGEVHLGGHAAETLPSGPLLIDAHGAAVADPVWSLYADVLDRAGPLPSLVEWDNDVPDWPVLLAEARRAQTLLSARTRHAAE